METLVSNGLEAHSVAPSDVWLVVELLALYSQVGLNVDLELVVEDGHEEDIKAVDILKRSLSCGHLVLQASKLDEVYLQRVRTGGRERRERGGEEERGREREMKYNLNARQSEYNHA